MIQQVESNDSSESAEDVEELSHRAEIFRSKLIEEFQILECTSEQGKEKVPIYNTTDIIPQDVMEKVLTESPEQMIKFKTYKRGFMKKVNIVDHRLTRVRNVKKLSYGIWANLVVQSSIFQNVLLVITVLNCLMIGIEGELELPQPSGNGTSNTPITAAVVAVAFFEIFDYISVILFSIEIILKWVDNFTEFWKSIWNVFDLIVTMISITSTIMLAVTAGRSSSAALTARKLSVFRILRGFKLVARLTRLQIVILTVLQTFQSLIFITLLFIIVSFIFAIIGIIFFNPDNTSPNTSTMYFSDLSTTFITLFQLFTLDQWYRIYQAIIKEHNPIGVLFYVILWIGIGSFIFRNLIIGIMVNNFQSLTAELAQKRESKGKRVELARMKKELSVEIIRYNDRIKQARESVVVPPNLYDASTLSEYEPQQDDHLVIEEKVSKGWDEAVEKNLEALSKPVETLWPRDTLFRYYQLMEQLQDNLEQFDKLQESVAESLLECHPVDHDEEQ